MLYSFFRHNLYLNDPVWTSLLCIGLFPAKLINIYDMVINQSIINFLDRDA